MPIDVVQGWPDPTAAEREIYNELVAQLVRVACSSSSGPPGIGVMPLLAAAKHVLAARPPALRLPSPHPSERIQRTAKLLTDIEAEIDNALTVIRAFEDEFAPGASGSSS